MGVGTLLRRRLLTHPVALVAVATSVLMSMVVVATLQLLSSAIADASVRTTLDVPATALGRPLTAGVRPGELADVDRAGARRRGARRAGCRRDPHLHRHLPRHRGPRRHRPGRPRRRRRPRRRAPSSPAARGRRHRATTWARAAARSRWCCPWPLPMRSAPGRGHAPRPRPTSSTATRTRSTSLVTGTSEPTGVDDGLWVDDPLGPRGGRRSDFTSYGRSSSRRGSFDRAFAGPRRHLALAPGGDDVTTEDLPASATGWRGHRGPPPHRRHRGRRHARPGGRRGGPAAARRPGQLGAARPARPRGPGQRAGPRVAPHAHRAPRRARHGIPRRGRRAAGVAARARDPPDADPRGLDAPARGAGHRPTPASSCCWARWARCSWHRCCRRPWPARPVSSSVRTGCASALDVGAAVVGRRADGAARDRRHRHHDAAGRPGARRRRRPVRAGSCACSPGRGSTCSSSGSGCSRSCSCAATTRPGRRPSTP